MKEKEPSDFATEGAEAAKRHLSVIESFFGVGRQLYEATANQQPGDFLIQQAHWVFGKTIMSLRAYLGFIQSSKYYEQEGNFVFDVSSASLMGRQILEDVLAFLYLSERNLSSEEREFRALVWKFHGTTEYVKSQEEQNPLDPVLSDVRDKGERALESLEKNSLFIALKKSDGRRYDDIKRGSQGYVVRDYEILKRHQIARKQYDLPRRILSNFVHFSSFSFVLMTKPERMEVPYYISILYLVRFVAEALGAFIETFPESARVLSKDGRDLIVSFRAQLRSQPV